MLYLIPAWYREGTYCEAEQPWYVSRLHTEYDDTVKQIQLFRRNHVTDYNVLVLGYSPNLRHFLHRQSVYHAVYWSAFDAIQHVSERRMRVLSYHDIAWPDGVEFVYTDRDIEVLRAGRIFARISFGEDGNPIRIDMFRQGVIARSNMYDDRGFVSCTIAYENGEPVYADYMSPQGVVVMRHFTADDHVEIGEQGGTFTIGGQEIPFRYRAYPSMGAVLEEVLEGFLMQCGGQDVFCVAMHPLHIRFLTGALQGRQTILSFYENRFPKNLYPEVRSQMLEANAIITDLAEKAAGIRNFLSKNSEPLVKIVDITPYDTRVDYGISGQLHVRKILLPVDGLEERVMAKALTVLAQYVSEHDNTELYLMTRMAGDAKVRALHKSVLEILAEAGLPEAMAGPEDPLQGEERELEDFTLVQQTRRAKESGEKRIYIEQCMDEREVSMYMREQRVLVDLRVVPELYLQITAISMGIPQIVQSGTQFVEEGQNGIIVRNLDDLTAALAHYLESLSNWNEANVSAYEIGKRYSTPELVRKWKEILGE